MNRKRTWQICRDNEVIQLFNKVLERSRALYPTLFENCIPQLYIDSSTTKLGHCDTQYNKTYYSKRELLQDKNLNRIRYRDGVIVLSKYILHDKEKVLDVLVHEFGHFVAPADHHGYLWRTRANNIGQIWNISNTRLDNSGTLKNGVISQEGNIFEKYVIECPKCHAQWKRQKMSDFIKHPSDYRCRKCKKTLIRIK